MILTYSLDPFSGGRSLAVSPQDGTGIGRRRGGAAGWPDVHRALQSLQRHPRGLFLSGRSGPTDGVAWTVGADSAAQKLAAGGVRSRGSPGPSRYCSGAGQPGVEGFRSHRLERSPGSVNLRARFSDKGMACETAPSSSMARSYHPDRLGLTQTRGRRAALFDAKEFLRWLTASPAGTSSSTPGWTIPSFAPMRTWPILGCRSAGGGLRDRLAPGSNAGSVGALRARCNARRVSSSPPQRCEDGATMWSRYDTYPRSGFPASGLFRCATGRYRASRKEQDRLRMLHDGSGGLREGRARLPPNPCLESRPGAPWTRRVIPWSG